MTQAGYTVKTVKAKKVRDGDFIPGLDNAYVPDLPERDDWRVTILFHDAEGEEGKVICSKDMPITIERK